MAAAIFLSFIVSGLAYAFSQPNVYEIETRLWPAKNLAPKTSDIGSKLGGLSSLLGGFAGGQENPDVEYYLLVVKSQPFLLNTIKKRHLVQHLFTKPGKNEFDALGKLLGSIQVNTEKSGEIRLSYISENGYLAKIMSNFILSSLNEYLRNEKIEMSTMDIKMLGEQIEQTQVSEIKMGLYSLTAEKMRDIALAKSRRNFAFNVIDPPYAKRKVGPKRLMITAGFSVIGLIAAVLTVLTIEYWDKFKELLRQD